MTNDVLTEAAMREAKRIGMGDVVVFAGVREIEFGHRREAVVRITWPDERKTTNYSRTVISPAARVDLLMLVRGLVQSLNDWYADKPWEQAS